MTFFLIYLSIVAILFSCKSTTNREKSFTKATSDQIFQYSVFAGLANKIYEGELTVSQIKEYGDIGLGTYNNLNGELIMLDGIVYQLLADGTIRYPADKELIPFVTATFFNEDQQLELAENSNYDSLKNYIEKQIPSRNLGYAFKISGTFRSIRCGGAFPQEKPYSKTLSEALVDRPQFQAEDVAGTMVGFWFPEFTGKVNITGFHLHFISDDHKTAGHVIDFQAQLLKIGIDHIAEFKIVLPENVDFKETTFDMSQDYNQPSITK